MNLIFAASVWARGEGAWRGEFPALARRNRLFLWQDVPESASRPIPPEIREVFEANRFSGLAEGIARHGLALDESALVGASPDSRRAAREVSLPCFYLPGDAEEARALRASGTENVFLSVEEVVDAVWKVNTVERRLFPIVTVGGLLFDEGRDVLRVRTRKWSGKWGIPGGKVDYGETLDAAFRREIREETGLELLETRLVLTQEAVEHPEFFRKRHFVLVNFFGRVAGRHPPVRLNHEGADYFWGPLEGSLNDAEHPLNGPTRVLAELAARQKQEGSSGWAF